MFAIQNKVLKEVVDWIMVIVVAFVAAFLIRKFLFTMVLVDGHSMDYTLADGDRLCATGLLYRPVCPVCSASGRCRPDASRYVGRHYHGHWLRHGVTRRRQHRRLRHHRPDYLT